MALYTFYQIFTVINQDTLELLHTTKIGGATLQKGDRITRGEIVGGLDFFRYIGNEMNVEVETDGTHVVKSVYV
jgi:hypothetical protein